MSRQGNGDHGPLRASQIDYTVIKAFCEVMLAANSKPLFSAISWRGGSICGKKRNISTCTCDFIGVEFFCDERKTKTSRISDWQQGINVRGELSRLSGLYENNTSLTFLS